jgi:hypothetical protein
MSDHFSEQPFLSGVLLVGTEPSFCPSSGVFQTSGPRDFAGAGRYRSPQPIPLDLAMVGLVFYLQGLFLDAGAPSGMSHTNGMLIKMQSPP